MGNFFDYINWRDIEIEKVEFNEIDAAILSRFSYFPLEFLDLETQKMTIEEAYKKFKNSEKKARAVMLRDLKFFPVLAQSKRFGKLVISNFVRHIDTSIEKQFSAIVIELPDDTICVSFEGTDNTLIGWKEDFNMSFMSQVPAQVEAVEYLNKIAEIYKDKKIRIVGHSKGGNLAVYSAAFCNKEFLDRIIEIYNFDGPGFHKEVINSNEYKNIKNKMRRYIPQDSVIGRLLNYDGTTIALNSSETGIMQHDSYSWQLIGDHFIEDKTTTSSEYIDTTLTDWLNKETPEQREKFVNILFDIIKSTGATTLAEMSSKKLETAQVLLKSYNNIDKNDKEIISKSLSILFQVAKDNIKIPKPNLGKLPKPDLKKLPKDIKLFNKKGG